MVLTEEQKAKLLEASRLMQEVLEQIHGEGAYSQNSVSTSIREARFSLNQAIHRTGKQRDDSAH